MATKRNGDNLEPQTELEKDQARTIASLNKRIAELAAALQPFANAARVVHIVPGVPMSQQYIWHTSRGQYLTIADLVNAERVLT